MGGKHFGQLEKIRGILYYRLSPYELNTFAGFFKNGIPNTIRRIRENIFVMTPPFVATYLIYDWAEKEHTRMSRKNPADYADEK